MSTPLVRIRARLASISSAPPPSGDHRYLRGVVRVAAIACLAFLTVAGALRGQTSAALVPLLFGAIVGLRARSASRGIAIAACVTIVYEPSAAAAIACGAALLSLLLVNHVLEPKH